MIARLGLGAVALALLAVVIAAGSVRSRLAPAGAPDAPAQVFVVQRGDVLGGVARALEARGLIRDGRALRWLARWREVDSKLRAGEYELSAAQSTGEILDVLTRGAVKTHPVVLPEGIRVGEIAQRLEAAGLAEASTFLALANDPEFARSLGIQADGLEGYLFPETYRLSRGLRAEDVARAMVGEFDRVWREIGALAQEREIELTQHQIVTLASIVEKETGVPEERPLIASVFLNRLARGMRLETDPTVIYGIADFDGNLKRVHLEDDTNPYNTYRIRSLPPGPIASPGRDALLAVVQPAESDYLYFVARGDGTHFFSRSYREHAQAVDQYQLRRRKR